MFACVHNESRISVMIMSLKDYYYYYYIVLYKYINRHARALSMVLNYISWADNAITFGPGCPSKITMLPSTGRKRSLVGCLWSPFGGAGHLQRTGSSSSLPGGHVNLLDLLHLLGMRYEKGMES